MADPGRFDAGWPALMSFETAARYLSVDESTLFRLADHFSVPAIEIADSPIRWRSWISTVTEYEGEGHSDPPASRVASDGILSKFFSDPG